MQSATEREQYIPIGKRPRTCEACGDVFFSDSLKTKTHTGKCSYEYRSAKLAGLTVPEWRLRMEEINEPLVEQTRLGANRESWEEVWRDVVSPAVASQPREVNLPAGRPFNDERNKKRIGFSPIRVATFDIETTGLNAAFGRILCCCVMSYDPQEIKTFRADEYPAWKAGRRSDDYEITAEIMAYLEQFDVLVAHNGVKFDLPFIRTRALAHGLPPLHPLKIVDPVLTARKALRMQSNSLDAIAKHLGAPDQKTPLLPETWARAMMDEDRSAMDSIVEHCIADVKVLDYVAHSIRGYVKTIDSIGSFR